jgi:hypothetical protein
VNSSAGRFFWHSNYAMLELWEDVMKMLEEDFSLFLKEEHESIYEMNRQDYLRKRAILAEKDKLLVSDGIFMSLSPQQNTRACLQTLFISLY